MYADDESGELTYEVGESVYTYRVKDDGTVKIIGYSGDEKEIVIPDEIEGKRVTRIGDYAFDGCSNLIDINVSESNTSYADVKGVLYDKECKELIRCPEGKKEITFMAMPTVTVR